MPRIENSHDCPGLTRIPDPLQPTVREFAALLRTLAGPRVEAWTVFGALAAGTFDATRNAIRSVVVLQEFDLEFLRRLAAQGERLGKSRFAAPLIMTPAYIAASRDTFPLALIEIQQCHVTIFGSEYFSDLTFEAAHVRLRCEHELKAVLIELHQGLLAVAGRENLLGLLEAEAAENLVRTMRGMLWLKGRRNAQSAEMVISQLEEQISRALPGVRAALDPDARHDWDVFQHLYQDVQTLGSIVDGW